MDKHTFTLKLECKPGEASVLAFPNLLRTIADLLDAGYSGMGGTKDNIRFDFDLTEIQ